MIYDALQRFTASLRYTRIYLQWLISTLKRRHREARHRPEIVRDDTSTSTRRYQLHNEARTPIIVEEELCTP